MRIEELSEEIFCVKYETTLFAQYVNYNSLERWIPGFSDKTTENSHIARYDLVSKYSKDKVMLDIACGTGKGSFILANSGAKNVLGIDIDKDAIRYAKHRYKSENLFFDNGDATKFNNPNNYDLIISFETIEHLNDISSYLKNINESLTKEGFFFVSTPISDKPLDLKPYNIYHVQEWGFYKFQEVISEFLEIDECFLQLYPKHTTNKFIYYWNRLFKKKIEEETLSTIYNFKDISSLKLIRNLGKSIRGYQILKCRKKVFQDV